MWLTNVDSANRKSGLVDLATEAGAARFFFSGSVKECTASVGYQVALPVCTLGIMCFGRVILAMNLQQTPRSHPS